MSILIRELERKIDYTFNNDRLLNTALTHSSYANEHKKDKIEYNERMEFLGDAVLELVSSDILFNRFPNMPEGEMTRLRASLVCEVTLAYDARQLELGKYLRLGKGEEITGGRSRDSVTSDALEALIGAIYLDSGLEQAYRFVEKFVMNDIENKKLFSDSKTHLQELVSSVSIEDVISYEIIDESGPDHDKCYEAVVKINDKVIGQGTGRNKKSAEQQAAYQALRTLDKRQ